MHNFPVFTVCHGSSGVMVVQVYSFTEMRAVLLASQPQDTICLTTTVSFKIPECSTLNRRYILHQLQPCSSLISRLCTESNGKAGQGLEIRLACFQIFATCLLIILTVITNEANPTMTAYVPLLYFVSKVQRDYSLYCWMINTNVLLTYHET